MINAIGGSKNLHSASDSGIIQASGKDDNSLTGDAEAWLHTQNETSLARRPPTRLGNRG
jgi:hypothetical protein